MHHLTSIVAFAALHLSFCLSFGLDLVNDVSVMQQVVVSHCMQDTQRSQCMPSSPTKSSARHLTNKHPFLRIFS